MKTLLTALLASLVLVAPAQAGSLFKTDSQNVEVASVVGQTGWLSVLSDADATPTKIKKTGKFTRHLVSFNEDVAPGTIIVDNSERRLYHVIGDNLAMVYPVAVGRDGMRWTGTHKVSAKAEWPAWNPPEEMRIREAAKGHVLPVRMEGGKDNPLGARALYLGSSEYRIHGTNQPESIGKFASSGCIRMANADVEHLYANVKLGAVVIVRD